MTEYVLGPSGEVLKTQGGDVISAIGPDGSIAILADEDAVLAHGDAERVRQRAERVMSASPTERLIEFPASEASQDVLDALNVALDRPDMIGRLEEVLSGAGPSLT